MLCKPEDVGEGVKCMEDGFEEDSYSEYDNKLLES